MERKSWMWQLLWYGSITVVQGDCTMVAFEMIGGCYGSHLTGITLAPSVYTCMGVFLRRPMGDTRHQI